MQTSCINTEKDFMSLLTGDIIDVTGFGAAAFGKYSVLSEPEPNNGANIPRVLVKTLQDDQEGELPFFLHFLNGKLLTDDGLATVDVKNDNICIVIERKE